MQRRQCPIYNGTIESFVWSSMNKITIFMFSKLLISIATYLRISWSKRRYLQHAWLRFQGYGCKSGIAIFAWWVTWNNAWTFHLWRVRNITSLVLGIGNFPGFKKFNPQTKCIQNANQLSRASRPCNRVEKVRKGIEFLPQTLIFQSLYVCSPMF